jgi:hypothetical protein
LSRGLFFLCSTEGYLDGLNALTISSGASSSPILDDYFSFTGDIILGSSLSITFDSTFSVLALSFTSLFFK